MLRVASLIKNSTAAVSLHHVVISRSSEDECVVLPVLVDAHVWYGVTHATVKEA